MVQVILWGSLFVSFFYFTINLALKKVNLSFYLKDLIENPVWWGSLALLLFPTRKFWAGRPEVKRRHEKKYCKLYMCPLYMLHSIVYIVQLARYL
jgi:hypothetical protein